MTAYYWHFCPVGRDGVPRLGYQDGREVKVGETLTVGGKPLLCQRGLHCSERIIDALRYAGGRVVLCRVVPAGQMVRGGDKLAAQQRTCVAMLTVEQTDALLREFARWCALSVAHLWEMPTEVRAYLETGDSSLLAAAADAYAYVYVGADAYVDAAAVHAAALSNYVSAAAIDARFAVSHEGGAGYDPARHAAARTAHETELRRLWREYTGEVLA